LPLSNHTSLVFALPAFNKLKPLQTEEVRRIKTSSLICQKKKSSAGISTILGNKSIPTVAGLHRASPSASPDKSKDKILFA
jgi:hypothetical protein